MRFKILRFAAIPLIVGTLLSCLSGCNSLPRLPVQTTGSSSLSSDPVSETPGGSESESESESESASELESESSGAQETEPPVYEPSKGQLLITEIMTSNANTIPDSFGEYSDWIELYNASELPLTLKNCYLSDAENKPKKFRLPNITLEAGDYLLVYASDRDTVTESGEIHASFKISAGEGVYLTCSNDQIASLLSPLDLPADLSYGLISDGEEYSSVYFGTPTPGSGNSGIYAEVFAELSYSSIGLRINEFMMKNKATLYDEDGDCPDWVELRNCSDQPISLLGFGLSDDFDEPLKWTFPDITLAPGDYILVLLSGKSREYTDTSIYLHADFKLSDTDDGLLLSTPKGLLIDRIAMVALPDSASYGRDPNEITAFRFFTRPTPGAENSQNGFETLSGFQAGLTKKVYISEVCAISSTSVDSLPNEDWIELYNNTDEAVSLLGWSISKSIADLKFYTFPDITLKPQEYLVIHAGAVASKSSKSLNVGFKISRSGNTLYLVDDEAFIVDAFSTGMQRAGVTSGQVVVNGSLVRHFYTVPTKGTQNNESSAASSFAQPALISASSQALIASSHTITLSTLQPQGILYYTLDGSTPTESSLRYTAPITLTESAVLRAIVYAPDLIPSEISTRTFLVENPHSLNIVCLTCNPDDLFGYYTGIWADGPGWTEESPHKGANFWQDWEKEVYFEYYELDGTLGIAFQAGIKNHGQYSRAQAQKSVSINLKEAYGSGTIQYPFFGQDEISTFDNLLLRTGGQDWKYTEVVDAYTTRVINGQMDLDYMRDLPVVVYVNGEYWGLYYIREKINESYLENHHGVAADNLDVIKGNNNAQTGTYTAHSELLSYVQTHDLSKQAYFDYVAERVDLEEWTNYWIVQTFFANTDTGNIRFWCTRDGEGKWRWILFDMDWALFRTTYTKNMIAEFLNPAGHGVKDRFSTVLTVNLMKNEAFRESFIETYALYLNTVFQTDRMLQILDEMVDQIKDEMPRQCERWGAVSYTKWEQNIDLLRTIITERREYAKRDLQESFGLSNERMAELFPAT